MLAIVPIKFGVNEGKEFFPSKEDWRERNMSKKKNDPYDLNACYEPSEPVPEEFINPWDREPTLADTAIYITDENGEEYYCCGNTKIKITEHFAKEGKTMGELLKELMIREAKNSTKD